MPSKIQLDENLWFLYICLQKSDMKSIDFTAVGASTNLKPPAARMRYTRLRRQIESGTLIGTHGTPFTEKSTKRKRGSTMKKSSDEDDDEDESPVKHNTAGAEKTRVAKQGEKGAKEGNGEGEGKGMAKDREEIKVKEEVEEDSNDFLTSDASSYEDSEDEMPLAKLRKAKEGTFYASCEEPPTMSCNSSDVPRLMAGGGMGFGGSGPAFTFPVGFNTSFNGGPGWENVDWAQYERQFGERLTPKGSL